MTITKQPLTSIRKELNVFSATSVTLGGYSFSPNSAEITESRRKTILFCFQSFVSWTAQA